MQRFYFYPIPALVTLIGVALFLRLAWWQWDKAERAQATMEHLEQRIGTGALTLGSRLVEADAFANRSVTVRGRYDASAQFFIDNQQHQGAPGLHVITPLRIEGTETRVLVNRGWIGWGASRDTLPRVAVPPEEVIVHGVAHVPSTKKRRWVSEEIGTSAQLKTRLDLERYQQEFGHPVQPIVILQNADDANDNLIRRWPTPENKTAMHQGYAVQWVLVAIVLVIFFAITSFRRPKA